MINIFYNLIAKDIIIVYLDNILIFIQTLEEHYRVVSRVLKVLAEHKLYLWPEKYKFNRQQIEYLCLVISKDKVKIDQVKVVRVCDWPILRNHTNLQIFHNFTNFYQRFIYGFLNVACSSLTSMEVIASEHELLANKILMIHWKQQSLLHWSWLLLIPLYYFR